MSLSVRPTVPDVLLSLRGNLPGRFAATVGPRLERLLAESRLAVTVRIESLQAHATLQALMRRLSRHGDRVAIVVHEDLWGRVEVDSSVFNLVPMGGETWRRAFEP